MKICPGSNLKGEFCTTWWFNLVPLHEPSSPPLLLFRIQRIPILRLNLAYYLISLHSPPFHPSIPSTGPSLAGLVAFRVILARMFFLQRQVNSDSWQMPPASIDFAVSFPAIIIHWLKSRVSRADMVAFGSLVWKRVLAQTVGNGNGYYCCCCWTWGRGALWFPLLLLHLRHLTLRLCPSDFCGKL